ncbi:alpha/beta fold hydrolase [Hoeflea sp.]|uniref:alpha/beta hydrolase n=1 Tax=Hoeflea sp. TaxID=1940281 RepID=UPI0025BC95A2|nr:alpha/beta fold hydrolase [Hoeflea sp.]
MLYFIAFLIFAGGLAFAFGPRPVADTSIDFAEAALPDDLDQYLEQSESGFEDLRPGSERQIVWAYPASKARTPLAIVYIHGFSAGPGETRPLSDIIAGELRANLYYARLAGHGRSGEAMLEGSVHTWVNDLAEAIAIGRRLGERVVIVATSTGASLAVWGAAQPDLMRDVAGLVQISPNYGLQAAGAGFLTMPWAEKLVPLIVGRNRSFEARNEMHAALWTAEYPSLALLPMAKLVDLANAIDVKKITVPSLFVYSPQDAIIQPDLARVKAENWGGPTRTIEVTDSDDPNNHVIAGDALSPSTTERLAAQIAGWIAGL